MTVRLILGPHIAIKREMGSTLEDQCHGATSLTLQAEASLPRSSSPWLSAHRHEVTRVYFISRCWNARYESGEEVSLRTVNHPQSTFSDHRWKTERGWGGWGQGKACLGGSDICVGLWSGSFSKQLPRFPVSPKLSDSYIHQTITLLPVLCSGAKGLPRNPQNPSLRGQSGHSTQGFLAMMSTRVRI